MIKINEKIAIGNEKPCFIIAEIGQNHQGDINLAKQIISVAKDSGADCVKFQKTCISEKFNKQALNKPYTTENSWGSTYGEHKSHLEFSHEQFYELQKYSEELDIIFTATPMDLISLQFLIEMKVPFLKIGSGDANNFLLIEEAAKTQLPLVISTGMQSFNIVQDIYEIVGDYHKQFVLLHCVSAYPTPPSDVHLNVLKLYQSEFPDIFVGYSGHELGFHITLAAVAMGARVIERHITLDKNLKGSDHKCSLEPKQFKEMCEAIRHIELAFGGFIKKLRPSEIACFEKLGKTLVAAKSLKIGAILCASDLKIKVAEPRGIDASKLKDIVGAVLLQDVVEDQSILDHYLNYICKE